MSKSDVSGRSPGGKSPSGPRASYTNKTPAELASARERNRLAPVPPAFGQGKDWQLRLVEWELADGNRCSCLVPNGMPVHENLHAYYWAERETYQDMLAATKSVGQTLREFLIVEMDTQRVVGAGPVHPTDGADEFAWLSCMFGELNNWKLAFLLPDDSIDVSRIKNAGRVELCADGSLDISSSSKAGGH